MSIKASLQLVLKNILLPELFFQYDFKKSSPEFFLFTPVLRHGSDSSFKYELWKSVLGHPRQFLAPKKT